MRDLPGVETAPSADGVKKCVAMSTRKSSATWQCTARSQIVSLWVKLLTSRRCIGCAKKKRPEEARREALTLAAEQGEFITTCRAQEIVRKHTASRPAIDVTASEPEHPDVIDVAATGMAQARTELEALISTLQNRSIPVPGNREAATLGC